jgi:Fe-S cluster assembly protein SufD
MKQLTEITTPYSEVAETATLPGAGLNWLTQLRQQARAQFDRQGLPAKKVEDWKYTSLWALSQQNFMHTAGESGVDAAQVNQVAALENAYRLVIIDGQYNADLSQLDSLEDGLSISSIADAFEQVESVLGQQVDIEKPGLTALNTMLMQDGVYVQVAAGQKISKPIEVLVISTAENAEVASHLRHVIQLDAGAEATVLEHYVSLAETNGFTNVVFEV